MNKVRLVLVVDEEIRDTLRAESGLSGEDMSDIAAKLIANGLAKTLQEVRARRAKAGKRKNPAPDAED